MGRARFPASRVPPLLPHTAPRRAPRSPPPLTPKTPATPDPRPPFEANWQDLGGEVRHTFTHFHLILQVKLAELPSGYNLSPGQELLTRHAFRPQDLPTVMRKAFDLWAGSEFNPGPNG